MAQTETRTQAAEVTPMVYIISYKLWRRPLNTYAAFHTVLKAFGGVEVIDGQWLISTAKPAAQLYLELAQHIVTDTYDDASVDHLFIAEITTNTIGTFATITHSQGIAERIRVASVVGTATRS